jgi:hypothetical protein
LNTVLDDIKKYHKYYNILADMLYDTNLTISTSNISTYPNVEECIEFIKQMKNKVSNSSYKDIIYTLSLHTNCIEDFTKRAKSVLMKSAIKINIVFTNFHQVKKNFLEIIEKLNKYGQGLPQIEKDFAYLLNPSYFPQAYHASIIEIKRRIIFNTKLNKDIDRVKQLIIKENYNRKQFIQDYGKYLTHDYVPQLKFSELKLNIEFFNNEELQNLPNLLDDEEELAVNNNNLILEYEDSGICSDNLIYRNNVSNNMSNRKSSEERNKEDNNTDAIRKLNAKIEELEISLRTKESHIKSILGKLDIKDRKITTIQSEMEKLASTVDNLSETFSKQVSHLNLKYKEKYNECENLLKILNNQTGGKLDSCPMCKDIACSNIEYSGFNNYVKEYYEKSNEKNKQLNKLETRFQDIVTQLTLIKRTFFNHLHNTIDLKNTEINNLKQNYEGKLMALEDLLSMARSKKDNNSHLEEELNKKTNIIHNLEIKIKDLNKIIANEEIEFKKVKVERDQLRKAIEDMKVKENNLIVDLKLKENRTESLAGDYKNLEKQNETNKMNFNKLSEEILIKVKEITNLKCTLDTKNKIIQELEKDLEMSKLSHIDTLKEINRTHQLSLEEVNEKLDKLTKELNEKTRAVEDYKYKNQELTSLLDKKIEEIKSLKNSVNKSQSDSSFKAKIEELTNIINEREKKINVFIKN